MRRSDREITDEKAIAAFLAHEQILRVGFYDKGEVYIVPVNYGCLCENGRYTFYFHGAKAGRKYQLCRSNPTVGFEVDGQYRLIEGETACQYTASFQSVIGTGTLQIVEDAAEKQIGLNALMQQATQSAEWEYSDAELETVAVFKLTVQKISCKGK